MDFKSLNLNETEITHTLSSILLVGLLRYLHKSGFKAETFGIRDDLDHLVEKLTRIPDDVGHHSNILDLLLTSHPDKYYNTIKAL